MAVKFVNRTSRSAFIELVDSDGNRELRQTVEAGKEWTVSTFEHTYWVATANRETDEGLLVNYGWFYSPKKSKSKRERVIITDCKLKILYPYLCFDFSKSSMSRIEWTRT